MQHAPITTMRSSRPLTDIDFCAWVAQAVPGDRLEYYRGFLALDGFPMASPLSDKDRKALRALADRALWAAEQRLVHLAQERLGPSSFAYIAVARPKPRAAEASLSRLLLEEEAAA